MINELRGDPALRDRYQFWLFMYPTGIPFPASAAHLRQALDDLREVVDPGRADSALDRMVVVGHSMGGLIAKMMVLDSGDALWNLVATRAVRGPEGERRTPGPAPAGLLLRPTNRRSVGSSSSPHRTGGQRTGRPVHWTAHQETDPAAWLAPVDLQSPAGPRTATISSRRRYVRASPPVSMSFAEITRCWRRYRV